MKNDYLWDGSGPADPELKKLERALRQFRSEARVPAFPDVKKELDTIRPYGFFSSWRPSRLAATSVLAAGVVLGVAGLFLRTVPLPPVAGWDVAQVEGTPIVGSS